MMPENKALKYITNIAFILLLILISVYILFPFYWTVNSSFKSETQLQMMPASFLPTDPDTGNISFNLTNYKSVLQNKEFLMGILNSIIVATATTFLALLAGSLAGFAMGQLRFRGKKITLYVILSMTMFPQVTVLTGLYAVMRALNLEPRLGMILSYMIFTLPFTAWVLTSFFKDLPREILESARVDGATFFQTFRFILLPLTAPALVTTGLLTFIRSWNEYLFALTFTSASRMSRTVPVVIAYFTGATTHQEPFGQIMAASVIVTVPIVVLVLYFQRKIVKGLTAGAVKG